MPRKVILAPQHDRRRSLWVALWWLETFTVYGDGDVAGQPVHHGDEYSEFILNAYCFGDDGRRLYDSVFFSRPKGTDKSGLAGRLALLEAVGPCRFEGWAAGGETYEFLGQTYTYRTGEAMGRPVVSPVVRILATEEGQTSNVYNTVYLNFTDGPLSQLKAYGLDAGLTRALLPEGGEIMPSTAGAASKDGGKETFVVADETHLYVTPTLRKMFNTVSRNLTKRALLAEPWLLQTSTMYAPGEDSIAEQSYKYAQDIEAGKTRNSRFMLDHRWGEIDESELGDEAKLRVALTDAYGDALEWMRLDSLVDEVYKPTSSTRDSMRYFLNALTAASDAWLTPQQIAAVTVSADDWRELVKPGERITLGFDGALTGDSTALVGCRVSDGLLFPVKVSEVPDGPEAANWRVDEEAFDAAVAGVFAEFDVVGFFADPPYWQRWLDSWEVQYGVNLRAKASHGSAVRFWTENPKQMVAALERLHTAIQSVDDVAVFGDHCLVRHFLNARVRARKQGDLIFKESPKSPLKIDAAMAATLAYAARSAFLLLGVGSSDKSDGGFYLPRRLA